MLSTVWSRGNGAGGVGGRGATGGSSQLATSQPSAVATVATAKSQQNGGTADRAWHQHQPGFPTQTPPPWKPTFHSPLQHQNQAKTNTPPWAMVMVMVMVMVVPSSVLARWARDSYFCYQYYYYYCCCQADGLDLLVQ